MKYTSSLNHISLVMVAVLFFFSLTIVFGQEINGMQEEILLEDKQLKLIELALAEFKKNNLDSSDYKLSLYRSGDSYIAIFEDSKITSNHRGSSLNVPSFEVKIDDNYEVIRSNFAR